MILSMASDSAMRAMTLLLLPTWDGREKKKKKKKKQYLLAGQGLRNKYRLAKNTLSLV
jgi:hypothetical protein